MTFAHGGRPPLESAATAAIRAAQSRIEPGRHRAYAPPQPKVLSEAERREEMDVIGKGGGCRCCGGLHAGDELACPRLATFELDGDGKIKGGSYWPDGTWDTARVLFAEDAAEATEEAGDGSG